MRSSDGLRSVSRKASGYKLRFDNYKQTDDPREINIKIILKARSSRARLADGRHYLFIHKKMLINCRA